MDRNNILYCKYFEKKQSAADAKIVFTFFEKRLGFIWTAENTLIDHTDF